MGNILSWVVVAGAATTWLLTTIHAYTVWGVMWGVYLTAFPPVAGLLMILTDFWVLGLASAVVFTVGGVVRERSSRQVKQFTHNLLNVSHV